MILKTIKNNSGLTIVEIIIAVLIIGTLSVATMGVLANIASTHKKRQFALDSATITASFNDELKLYNTLDPDITEGAPGNPPWHMEGTTCPGGGTSCWSLAVGTHTATDWLPGSFKEKYPNAKLTYVVEKRKTGNTEDPGLYVIIKIENPDD